MFGVQPGQGCIRVKWGFPDEGAVGLDFHAEERIGEGGEVVIVDAGVDKGCRKADLWVRVSGACREILRVGTVPGVCNSPQ